MRKRMAENKVENGINRTSDHKKDKGNRILIIIISVLCGLSIILFSIVLYFSLKKNDDVCLTRDCTLTAATLISAMDHSFDPCEDFYKFTCANFIRKNPVPEHKTSVRVLYQYYDTLQLQLKDLIENHVAYKDPEVVMKMQETYHVCINTSYHSDNEFAALKAIIEDVFDGWPIAHGSKWKSKFERLDDYMANILLFGIPYVPFVHIFAEEIYDEIINKTVWQPMIYFYGTHLSFRLNSLIQTSKLENGNAEQESEYENRKRTAMEKFLKGFLKFFGNPNEFEVIREIKKMEAYKAYTQEIENELNNGIANFTEMTINELTEALNHKIDWLKIINAKFHRKHIYTNSSKVFIRNLEAIKKIPHIMITYSRRDIVNSFVWSIIFPDLLKYLGIPEITRLLDTYYEDIDLRSEITPRWKICLDQIQNFYPMVLTRLFVNKFVDKNGKVIADEMVQLIEKAYKGRIQNSNWLDDSTKKRALKKADAIRRFVAYPEFIFSDKELEKEYLRIPFPNSTWFWTILGMYHVLWDNVFVIFQEDMETKWNVNPLTINAFYGAGNSIWFPSGILQLPFFDENRLAAVNFGMIGSIIGHEIGHAFDNHGSTFNEAGEEEMWWSNETARLFEKKTQCFINQYSEYCPEELQGGKAEEKICVNGDYTVGENMADNTGLKAALDAYKLWIKKYGTEPRLPGLEQYSPDQVFFISYGYMWCENLPLDKWIDRYQDDSHSPANYRVQGTLSNTPEFREVFNCKKGPYNRESESCVVW